MRRKAPGGTPVTPDYKSRCGAQERDPRPSMILAELLSRGFINAITFGLPPAEVADRANASTSDNKGLCKLS